VHKNFVYFVILATNIKKRKRFKTIIKIIIISNILDTKHIIFYMPYFFTLKLIIYQIYTYINISNIYIYIYIHIYIYILTSFYDYFKNSKQYFLDGPLVVEYLMY